MLNHRVNMRRLSQQLKVRYQVVVRYLSCWNADRSECKDDDEGVVLAIMMIKLLRYHSLVGR